MIKCLKSGVKTNLSGRRIIENPVIDPNLLGEQKLFRLYERPRLIIINTSTKEIIEHAELQGVSITKLKDYISL